MQTFETEAIVIKTGDLSEADKIVWFLTERYGAARLTARGARRLKSRFSGRLEPFTIVEIAFAQKEAVELGRLRAIETVASYFHLANRPGAMQIWGHFAELLLAFAPPGDVNERLYRLTRACLPVVAEHNGDPRRRRLITVYFEIWLLRLAGLLPDVELCVGCARRFAASELAISGDRGFLCRNCESPARFVSGQRAARLLRRALRKSPVDFAGQEFFEPNDSDAVSRLTLRLLRTYLERDPFERQTKIWQGDPILAAGLIENRQESHGGD